MNDTPIYDIKPYLPEADSHPEGRACFTERIQDHKLEVDFPEGLLRRVPEELRKCWAWPCWQMIHDQATRKTLTGNMAWHSADKISILKLWEIF